MKAFVVKMSEFFMLDTRKDSDSNFATDKKKLLIPLYQREYKWKDDKIESLLNDILKRDKFLGNIILDELDDCYEIVDGQQRITTCFLLLMSLFNSYIGHPREQQSIKSFLKPDDNSFVLKNNSIGDYLSEVADRIVLNIRNENDVYFQKEDFIRANNTIQRFMDSLNTVEYKHDFKQKLLDCQFLVLINDQHTHTRPVEQLFLDINEKAQLLDVEDIFKGHCFENYDDEAHSDLRTTWINLKKCGMYFLKFGFSDVSQYIYLYLLESDSSDIPEKLTIKGKHYLEGKTMDETEQLLSNMISYGDSIIRFFENICNNNYRFEDLCQNSHEYRNTDDHIMIKFMAFRMLMAKAQYPKLPLMNLIYSLTNNEALKSTITHDQFKRIITNLYIYLALLIQNGNRKSKQIIDHTVRDSLGIQPIAVQNIVNSTKELRKAEVDKFLLKKNENFEDLCFIYSIMDFYVSDRNWITNMYSRENHYNLEHFIIPDNKPCKVTWKNGNQRFEISISAANKKKTLNCLVIEDALNGIIEHNDIVSKISSIRKWHLDLHHNIPKHVEIIINSIESMPEYIVLSDAKETIIDQVEIEMKYNAFITAYFEEENQQRLCLMLQEHFKVVFQN